MRGTVSVRSFPAPEINRREILRYAGIHPAPSGAGSSIPADDSGIGAGGQTLQMLLDECLREAEGRLSYRVCAREFRLAQCGTVLDLGFARTESVALRKNLEGCRSLVLFAATVGIGLDRLIEKYTRLSPARAVMLQAIGAERIESLCDVFAQELAEQAAAEGLSLRPRFSPGYGDFPLAMQKPIFEALDCSCKIGLTLNGSLLMSPSKSVTAVIGLASGKGGQERGGATECGGCSRKDCSYRREI